jgi:hypothetical protein
VPGLIDAVGWVGCDDGWWFSGLCPVEGEVQGTCVVSEQFETCPERMRRAALSPFGLCMLSLGCFNLKVFSC